MTASFPHATPSLTLIAALALALPAATPAAGQAIYWDGPRSQCFIVSKDWRAEDCVGQGANHCIVSARKAGMRDPDIVGDCVSMELKAWEGELEHMMRTFELHYAENFPDDVAQVRPDHAGWRALIAAECAAHARAKPPRAIAAEECQMLAVATKAMEVARAIMLPPYKPDWSR